MDKSYCVYKHTAPNGKVYIGVTRKKPSRRWNNGKGYVRNKHFYSAIQKYGWENIKHEIVLKDLTKKQASQGERDLIRLYKANDPSYGYNHTSGGYDGYELNDAQKRAISERVHRQFSDDEFKTKFDLMMKDPGRRKRVSDGLKRYYESPEAREKASFAQKKKLEDDSYRERLRDAARKRSANPEYRENLSRILTEKRNTEEYRQSVTGERNPNAKGVLQYSLDGILIERFGSIMDACRKCDCDHANIVACANGRTKYAYGFIWVYEGDERSAKKKAEALCNYINPKSRPILQCDLSGNTVREFQSISEAADTIGASSGTLCMALKGKRKTAYGYTWKYADCKKEAAL